MGCSLASNTDDVHPHNNNNNDTFDDPHQPGPGHQQQQQEEEALERSLSTSMAADANSSGGQAARQSSPHPRQPEGDDEEHHQSPAAPVAVHIRRNPLLPSLPRLPPAATTGVEGGTPATHYIERLPDDIVSRGLGVTVAPDLPPVQRRRRRIPLTRSMLSSHNDHALSVASMQPNSVTLQSSSQIITTPSHTDSMNISGWLADVSAEASP